MKLIRDSSVIRVTWLKKETSVFNSVSALFYSRIRYTQSVQISLNLIQLILYCFDKKIICGFSRLTWYFTFYILSVVVIFSICL